MGNAVAASLKQRLNPHLLNIASLPQNPQIRVTSPDQLMYDHRRFDLVLKLIYARSRAQEIATDWGLEVYAEHVRAFTNGTLDEGDGSGKCGLDAFVTSFQKTLDSIQSRGFDQQESVIPVSSAGTIIDGSHRTVAAYVHDRPVATIEFERLQPVYDYRFFASRGLEQKYLDAAAFEYCRINPHAHVACVFPVASGHDGEIEEILGSVGSIFYQMTFALKNEGPTNLVRELYDGEPWLGTASDGYSGARLRAAQSCPKGGSVRVYVLSANHDLDSVKDAKLRLREIFCVGNDSVHITDTHPQAVRAAQIFFNENSRNYLNYAKIANFDNFKNLFAQYKQLAKDASVNPEDLCVDGSAAMSAYGIRDCGDFDYLIHSDKRLDSLSGLVNCHNEELKYHSYTLDELTFDPRRFFYCGGMKFVSINSLREMKSRRDEPKDRVDVRQMSRCVHPVWSSLSRWPRNSAQTVKKVCRRVKQFARNPMQCLHEAKSPKIRTIDYLGFKLSYSFGTSIVESFRKHGEYAADVQRTICRELAGVEKPTVLDIGANVGMISLGILQQFPKAKIFAFEPGQHQFSLLRKTIQNNGLASRIVASSLALSDARGFRGFVAHKPKDASGDGFVDTQRVHGPVKHVTVRTNTLDNWWIENSRPSVDLIKIDTEGAELLILRGASELLRQERPVICLEIWPENVKNYPYDTTDLVKALHAAGYQLEALDGLAITSKNEQDHIGVFADFVARPRRQAA